MLGFLRSLVANPLIQRIVGADLQAALADQAYTVYVKGAKMAQVADGGSTIYDLDAGTITTIDPDKRTYATETFDDLRAQIGRAQQWMKHSKGDTVAFDVSVEKTDETRAINGRTATKSLITMTAQSESSWGRPVVNAVTWLAPVDSGTRPLYEFARRAAAKLSSVFTLVPSFFGAAADGSGTASADLQKLNGISVLDQIAVTGVTNPLTSLFANNRASQAANAVITLEIRSSDFSSAPVDPSRFTIPAGFSAEQRHR